ncbi:hypothetical protein M405DRAFT_916841 [Rhizopogon salebrosus TDB-379]|nr:hypothetical protein M405DRAFT_916841 [Rhizopogon salebrosus TDB-379]
MATDVWFTQGNLPSWTWWSNLASIFKLMGIGPDGVIIVHGEATLSKIRRITREGPPKEVHGKLVLENDELCYNTADHQCAKSWILHSSSTTTMIGSTYLLTSLGDYQTHHRNFARHGIKPKQYLSEPRHGATVTIMERRDMWIVDVRSYIGSCQMIWGASYHFDRLQTTLRVKQKVTAVVREAQVPDADTGALRQGSTLKEMREVTFQWINRRPIPLNETNPLGNTNQCHLPPLPTSDIEFDKDSLPLGSHRGKLAAYPGPEYESRIQATLADA